MSARSAKRGLSARVTRAAIVIGGLTILAAIAIAFMSQSRLASMNARSTDTVLIQAIEEQVLSRLSALSASVEEARTGPSKTGPGLLGRFDAMFDSDDSHLEMLVVCDESGRVLLGKSHDDEVPPSAKALPAFKAATAGRSGFLTVNRAGRDCELWLVRSAFDESGTPLYVLAQAETRFLQKMIDSVSRGSAQRSILVLHGRHQVCASSDAADLDLARARWSDKRGYVSDVSMRTTGGDQLLGHFRDIGVLEGFNWRILVAASRSAAYYEMVMLSLPLVAVLMTGGAIALISAWGMSLGMTTPLRDLQRAARAAAAGAYVKPLAVTRQDEIGEVSKAFNAVALRLNALHDMSQLLASASRTDEVLDGIIGVVGHLIGEGSVAVFLREDGVFTPVRTRGKEMSRLGPVDAGASTWFTKALETGEPVEWRYESEEFVLPAAGNALEGLAAAAVPLIAQGQALGVVVTGRQGAGPFSEAELEMLKTFAAQAAVALHTSTLFEEESEARRMAQALRKIAELLVRPERLEEALKVVEGTICELFSAVDVRLVISHPSAIGLEASTRDGDAELLALGLERLVQAPPDGVVVRLGESVQGDAALERAGSRRCRLYLISAGSGHPAVLAVHLNRNDLEAGEVSAAKAIVDVISLALDNAASYHQALARADNLQNVFHISQAVGSPLNLNVVLNRVLEVVQKILSADALALMSYDPRRRTLQMSMGRGALPKGLTEVELRIGEDIPGAVFERGEPVVLKSMKRELGGIAGMSAAAGLRSLLAVPLVARGRAVGVLMVFAGHKGGFAEEDVNLLQTFASQAALAIDTARLYGREHEVARVLQASILPEALPDLPELEAGSVYAPAGEDTDIGGDYYDVFRTPDASIWVVMGDVCGKGIHAATKTSMVKYVVRAFAHVGLDPQDVIARANDMISATGEPSDIVTLWVGRYNATDALLTWANGGHPPALLRRHDGSVESLEPTGPLLGALAGAHYEEREAALGSGDVLLLYTDGVSEARSGNTFFGTERVKRVLGESGSPSETARRLLVKVREHVKGELRDDVAVLVVAPREPVGAGPWEEES